MSHAPGPWHYWTAGADDRDAGAFVVYESDRPEAAIICDRAAWPHRAQESAANGRLIAAAPRLLAALQAILANATNSDFEEPTANGRELSEGRAAIAEALGEERP